MSQDELSIILSPQAVDDFADILQYTFQTWSEKQMHVYRSVIDKALITIQQNPEIGHRRPEISKNHRSFPAGQHVIFYRADQHAIYVSRILHERMDTKSAF
ncbi:type II toxin-antitoxin system RelE/ParE family toxin [Methylomonas koyamae]|uniref:type II toxin-antitoxin system RelE/ParE family toxin n=1 Tax=Methylomonas koyamae TaxID=702114 RepID=UPI002872ED0A|nr:type II toxin-antitoxin system RelE/ParE family toxin [Methylomonas koyamae]WNB76759.1 type II toxin-antitoxin system RelE/ParE family toxin [Methylomonas koyamae]